MAGLDGIFPTDLKWSRDGKRIWLCASPVSLYPDRKLAGGFFRSDDGKTFARVTEKLPTELIEDPTAAPGRLLAIFDETAIRASDDGTTWREFSSGLPVSGQNANGDGLSESRFGALGAGPGFVLTASTRGTFYRLDKG